MKHLLLSVMLFTSIFANAQVTNTDFENWTNDDPDGWWSLDQLAPVNMCVQETDAHSGSYAAKVQTVDFNGQVFSGTLALTNFTEEATESGIPYTLRPTQFSFWAKYNTAGDDSVLIVAQLTKWNGTEPVVVGEAGVILQGTSNTYTQYTPQFVYDSNDAPDSLQIIILVSQPELGIATLGSYVIIDELEIDGGAVPGPPAAPSNLVATPQKTAANNGVLLSWQDNSNNETEFVIERATTQAGSYSEIGTVLTDVNTYLDNTTADNTTYYYRVYASNNDGNSNVSNVADATAGTSVGIENSIAEAIQLYPNPNTGKFNITLPENITVAKVKVFTILGEELFSGTIENGELSINLNIANGNYIVEIAHESNTIVKRLTVNQ